MPGVRLGGGLLVAVLALRLAVGRGHVLHLGGSSIDSGLFRAAFGANFQAIFCPIELGMELQ